MPSTDGGPCYNDAEVEKGRRAIKLLAAWCEATENGQTRVPDTVQEWWLGYKRNQAEDQAYHRKVRIAEAKRMRDEAVRLAENAERLMKEE